MSVANNTTDKAAATTCLSWPSATRSSPWASLALMFEARQKAPAMWIFWSNSLKHRTFFKFMDLEEDLAALLGLKVYVVTRSALRGNRGNRILYEVVSI